MAMFAFFANMGLLPSLGRSTRGSSSLQSPKGKSCARFEALEGTDARRRSLLPPRARKQEGRIEETEIAGRSPHPSVPSPDSCPDPLGIGADTRASRLISTNHPWKWCDPAPSNQRAQCPGAQFHSFKKF